MRILVVGHGRMGTLVAARASAHGCEVAGLADNPSDMTRFESGAFDPVDVAIDFSEPPAVPVNLPLLAARGVSVVIGTTGWAEWEGELRAVVERTGIAVMASANFALGLHVFRAAVAEAARRFATMDDVGAWIHEAHHAAKKDAPSGTALLLKKTMIEAGYGRPIDVSSTRAGSIPGTHTVGFDARAETVTFTHTVRDRAVFAHGALEAARWLKGRRGWFTIDDMNEA